MNILVVGCNSIGRFLIRRLKESGHDVSVLQERYGETDQLEHEMDLEASGIIVVQGQAKDIDDLRKAGIEHVDAVAAVTTDDNKNIMVAQMASTIFHIPHVVCSVEDQNRKLVFSDDSNIKAICPTTLTANGLLELLLGTHEIAHITFGNTQIACTLLDVPPRMVGRHLGRFACPQDMLVLGVLHGDGLFQLTGTATAPLARTDRIVLCGAGS